MKPLTDIQRSVLTALTAAPASICAITELMQISRNGQRSQQVKYHLDKFVERGLAVIDEERSVGIKKVYAITRMGRDALTHGAAQTDAAKPRVIDLMHRDLYIPHPAYCRNNGHVGIASKGTAC